MPISETTDWPRAIVIVDDTAWAGLIVRWYLTDKPEDCGEMVQPDLTASREGVTIGTFLHRVEGPLLHHAKGLHAALAEGNEEELRQIKLAIPTHVRVPWGPPEAVGREEAAGVTRPNPTDGKEHEHDGYCLKAGGVCSPEAQGWAATAPNPGQAQS